MERRKAMRWFIWKATTLKDILKEVRTRRKEDFETKVSTVHELEVERRSFFEQDFECSG